MGAHVCEHSPGAGLAERHMRDQRVRKFASEIEHDCEETRLGCFTTSSRGQNCTTLVNWPRRPGGTTMVKPSSSVPFCGCRTLKT